MTALAELDLPTFDYTAEDLRGDRFHAVMGELIASGWLARSELGWLFVLDRESATFFLRSRAVEFPAKTVIAAMGIAEGPLFEAISRNLISAEGDDHRRLRNLVNPAFNSRAADRLRPAMREHLAALWGEIASAGSCEFVERFAKRYPSQMIARVVGAPVEDWPRLHAWATSFQKQFDPIAIVNERAALEAAIVEFHDYAGALIEARRDDPRDDLISTLLQATHEGDRLSEEECLNLVMNVIAGGVDTTQAQLAHAIRLFAAAPDQWDLLAAEPERVPAAVEEVLRYEPITPFTARMTVEDVVFRDVEIPAGTVVLVSTFAGNRDPGAVEEPNRFDVTAERGRVKPMTFGAGIHNCLGANLARAELQEAFAFLAPRMRELELDGEPVFESVPGVYGLERLPIRFRAAGPDASGNGTGGAG
jgi:cytochrome P450